MYGGNRYRAAKLKLDRQMKWNLLRGLALECGTGYGLLPQSGWYLNCYSKVSLTSPDGHSILADKLRNGLQLYSLRESGRVPYVSVLTVGSPSSQTHLHQI